MLKIISKTNCPRCENIKEYLNKYDVQYEVEMAEDKGYEYWRAGCMEMTGKLGFPILIKDEVWVNGSTEEIIGWLAEKVEPKEDPNSIENLRKIFDWAV